MVAHNIESIKDREAKINLVSQELVFLWLEQGQALNSLGMSARRIESVTGISKSRASRYMQIASDSRILKQLAKGNLLEGFTQSGLVELTKVGELEFVEQTEGKFKALIAAINVAAEVTSLVNGKRVFTPREHKYLTDRVTELTNYYNEDEDMVVDLCAGLRRQVSRLYIIKGWTI